MISVCIATYNGEKYIELQLRSILSQLGEEDEVIVSDDKSKDKTIEIIKNINDPRIRIIENSGKAGVIWNFENALKHANGDFIFLSDQDDIWMPDKVDIYLKLLQKYSLVFSNAIIVNDKLERQRLLYPEGKRTGFIRNLLKNNFIGATMAFKKSILEKSLPFPSSIPMHDQWIGLLAELDENVFYIDEPFLLYRKHQNNVSVTGEKSNNSIYQQVKFRLGISKALIKYKLRK